jgi:hypothetical protein
MLMFKPPDLKMYVRRTSLAAENAGTKAWLHGKESERVRTLIELLVPTGKEAYNRRSTISVAFRLFGNLNLRRIPTCVAFTVSSRCS